MPVQTEPLRAASNERLRMNGMGGRQAVVIWQGLCYCYFICNTARLHGGGWQTRARARSCFPSLFFMIAVPWYDWRVWRLHQHACCAPCLANANILIFPWMQSSPPPLGSYTQTSLSIVVIHLREKKGKRKKYCIAHPLDVVGKQLHTLDTLKHCTSREAVSAGVVSCL